MKKLLAIVVLGLMLTGEAGAQISAPIKHKRIECSFHLMPQRWNNLFIIISDNDKKAELIYIPWDKVEKFQATITKDLQSITFKLANKKKPMYVLNRETGIIKVYANNKYNHKKSCEPFSKNLDPEQFLQNEINSWKYQRIEKNKF